MPVLSLPLTFGNSFWSQDYRKGLAVLYAKLEQGVEENDEVVNFIRARAAAERTLGTSLASPAPTGPKGRGFGADDGASLLVTFRCLQAESAVQGKAHLTLSKELDTTVADPFEEWAHAHKERVRNSKEDMLNGWLLAYEDGVSEVTKLKKKYLDKTRKADEAEDDAKFAPNYAPKDPYTASPKINQSNGTVQRTPSVSERIQQRLAELKKPNSPTGTSASGGSGDQTAVSPSSDKHDGEATSRILDKGKGKAIEVDVPASPLPMSPPPMSPPLPPAKITSPSTANLIPPPPLPMLLAGVSFQPTAVSAILAQAQQRMKLRPVRFPIIGEYQDVFSGAEFATFLVEGVPAFNGSLDIAEEAARELTERDNVLRRVGEFGNKFENSTEAFYQFRAKAFDLASEVATRHADVIGSPTDDATPMPLTARLVKRSGTLANFVTTVIQNNTSSEPPYLRARSEALEASQVYRTAVRALDRRRLNFEERVEDTLKLLQTWERDRLRAVKTVLGQYQAALGPLHPTLKESTERSNEFVNSFRPENDLIALIERYRTGPFRPTPQVFESAAHVVGDVVFGIDLSSWAGEGGWNAVRAGGAAEPKDTVPSVLRGLLTGLEAAYERMADDDQRRKSWIYDVPLPAIHHLRESINALPADSPIPAELLAKYDAPIIAGTIKLWLLELNPPLATWDGWDEIRRIYPSVGADSNPEEKGALAHIDDLKTALYKLPKVHLYVLDAVVQHFNQLIEKTAGVQEDKEMYMTKLALSVGRAILRPKVETEIAIQDRSPTLFFLDLLKHYTETLPPTITKKKRDSERPVPTKKRTAPIDVRMCRSRLSAQGLDPKQVYQQQISHSRNPSRTRADSATALPPVPGTPPPPPLPARAASPPQDPNAPPPRPMHFAEPVDDDEAQSQDLTISPPTPQPNSPPLPVEQETSPMSAASPASPAPEDKPIAVTGGTGLNRTGSGGVMRGPRPAKGPRAAPGTPTSALARPAAHTRAGSSTSSARPASPAVDPHEYDPKGKKGGRVAAGTFSRRTVASDTEEEVLNQ